jgi:NAD+ dependent glucose-6-phosphate dehydrogenase
MKTILLTGISGILGQILYKGLKGQYDIYGLDIKIEEDAKNFKADVSDFEALTKVFEKLPSIDAIVHFAADPYPFAHWDLTLQHNVIGTKNIYECAKVYGVPKVVFASSTHAVGKYPGYPQRIEGKEFLTTADPVRPDEFYGLSKAMNELNGQMYSDLFNISSINLRIGHTTADTNPDHDLDKLELYEDDLVDIVQKSIESNVKFGIYFAVSDNPGRFLDIENAKKDLGYDPKKRS